MKLPAFSVNAIDETGNRYGRLLVIGPAPKLASSNHLRWVCRCDCGAIRTIKGSHLRESDGTHSCGCQTSNRTHGGTSAATGAHPEYRVWRAMIQRCHLPTSPAYGDYGGRRIAVCDRWRSSYQAFINDMGRRPAADLTIERIDNDGNYEPSNCRWATRTEQGRNKRNNHFLTVNGETRIVADWEKAMGFRKGIVLDRLKAGWSPERAVMEPLTDPHERARRAGEAFARKVGAR